MKLIAKKDGRVLLRQIGLGYVGPHYDEGREIEWRTFRAGDVLPKLRDGFVWSDPNDVTEWVES